MPTTESRLMRVEERQSDLRVKVAGLESTTGHHTSWIEAHRARATAMEQRQVAIEAGQADLGWHLKVAIADIGRLQSSMMWVASELKRLATEPPPSGLKRIELPAAVAVLAMSVLARLLGVDLSSYLPGGIR